MIGIFKKIRQFRYIMSCFDNFKDYPIWEELGMGVNFSNMWMVVELPDEIAEADNTDVENQYVASAINPINDGLLSMGIVNDQISVDVKRLERDETVYYFISISPKINIKMVNVLAWVVFITAIIISEAKYNLFTNLFY